MRVPNHWNEIRPLAGKGHATTAGLDRRLRMPVYVDAPTDAAERIGRRDVTLVGAGSIGLTVSDGLARLGVRALRIVDRSSTKPASALTHPIRPDEIGRPKASLAASRAKAICPQTRVLAFDGPVEALPRDAFAGSSLVVLASDNLACEVAVAQRCSQLGIPLLQVSVYGRMLVGQLRWLENGAAGEDPCLCCALTEREWSDLDRAVRFSCEAGHAAASVPERSEVPTASSPHLCASTANLALGEIVRRTLELGADAGPGSMLEYCGYTQRITRTPLTRRSDCPCEHKSWALVSREGSLVAHTPRELLQLAGYADSDSRSLSLSVEGYLFSELEACACATHPRLSRFLQAGAAPTRCPDCDSARAAHPMYSHEEVPVVALAGQLDHRLAELGVASAPTVLVRGSRGTTLLHSDDAARAATRGGASGRRRAAASAQPQHAGGIR